jgi:putative transposase
MFHVTWISKYRKKKIYGKLRQYLGETLREIAKQKECELLLPEILEDGLRTLPDSISGQEAIIYPK